MSYRDFKRCVLKICHLNLTHMNLAVLLILEPAKLQHPWRVKEVNNFFK